MERTALKSESGSLMIESIVAMSLVIVGILGIMNLLVSSTHVSVNATDDLTATSLAGEGIEVVKNVLDAAYIAGVPFSSALPSGSSTVDYSSTSLTPNGPTGVYLDANNLYNQSGAGTQTIFDREMGVNYLTASSVLVDSVVTWTQDGTPRKVDLEDVFTSWRY